MVEYQRLTHEYSIAVGKLAVTRLSAEEYERLRKQADKARIASREARERLNRHIAEHRC